MSDKNNEIGELTIQECLKCFGFIIAGVFLFIFIPDEVGIFGWILFVVGTVLIVIGVFRLVAFIPKPEGRIGSAIWRVLFAIAAVYIQVCGLVYLYNTRGTGKGIIVATLALCVSLGLMSSVIDEKNRKLFKASIIISRVLCIVIPGLAVYLNIRDGFSDASIYVGTMLLIEFFIIWEYARLSLKSVSDEKQG